ncbi:PREDICTED: CD276 antigen [Galeopterus variegatus]|uniref:CD276 antigen n=1 Tax=Galeopterus variegatus TaxID=482537 RepID=A0ABM0R419_GALVR|nr:PREDICTED: CD276 antigen [Galeopterus variegatus]
MPWRQGSPGMGVHVGTALGVLWFCLTGALEVQVPEDPVVALVGTNATLCCSFSPEPGFSLAQLNLIWQLTDTKHLKSPCRSSLPHPSDPPPGAVEVQVPEDPVVALVGTNATLCCSFSPEPGFSLAQLNLIWQLTDTKQLVHSFAEGRDQGSAYANRTALFPDLLAQGNASLRLQRVRVADEGSFTCFVSIRDFGSAAVSLQVAAPYSKPSMTLEPNKDLCLVRNPVLKQDAHGSVTITGQPMTFPPEALWVTVGLSVCLVALLVALAFVCWRKIKQSCEEENAGAEDQDGEGEGPKTALQPLKRSESKEGPRGCSSSQATPEEGEDDGQEIA